MSGGSSILRWAGNDPWVYVLWMLLGRVASLKSGGSVRLIHKSPALIDPPRTHPLERTASFDGLEEEMFPTKVKVNW